MPRLVTRAWNLTKALAAFVADGIATVSKEEYERRLGICDGCVPPDGWRVGAVCRHTGCGCYIAVKAKGRAWKCQVGKWDEKPSCGESTTGV